MPQKDMNLVNLSVQLDRNLLNALNMIEQTIREFNKQFEYDPIIEGSIKSAKKFVVAGMGGSHLAVDLIKVFDPYLELVIHKNYGLPYSIDEESLFIANSYSGNTEEVLDFFNKAVEKKLNIVAISTGGKLIDLAKENNVSYIQIPSTSIQPRSALGYSIKALLKAMGKEDWLKEISELNSTLDPVSLEKEGEELAKKIKGKIPVIYSSEKNEGLAVNWKVRFNETAKTPAFYNVFPELNHNEMIGFDKKMNDSGLADNFFFIFLKDNDNPRIQKRMEILQKLLEDRELPVEILELKESNKFYLIFSSIILADWTSYHLAQLYNVDPEHISLVEEFKKMI